jgi:WD40 repeat protein
VPSRDRWVELMCIFRVSLLAALTLGCAGGMKYAHVLGVSPDGQQLLMSQDEQLQLRDLESSKRLWRQSVESYWLDAPKTMVEWSQDGAYFAIAEEHFSISLRGHYAVWERATGHRISPVYRMYGLEGTMLTPIAVSNDGRWFAAHGPNLLRVYDNRSGRVVLEIPDREPRFSPDASRLATDHQLLELQAGEWRTIAELPRPVDTPLIGFLGTQRTWIGPRLAVATDNAVEIWNDARRVLSIGTRGPVSLASGEHLLAIIEPVQPEEFKYSGHAERLTVYEPETGNQRFVRDDLGGELQLVFRGDRIFVLAVQKGPKTFILELDNRTGKALRSKQIRGWLDLMDSSYPELLPGAYYFRMNEYHERYAAVYTKLEFY